MFLRMLQRANYILTEYQIFDFPVPLEVIEQIITDMNIKIIINKYLKTSLFVEGEILTGQKRPSLYREDFTHEICHIQYHPTNTYMIDKIILAKNEAQAQAFAAYFLMPVFIFESDLMEGLSDYELSENFGVTIDFVRYRKTLTEGLLNINYFEVDK